jgi:hypothetical protein
MLPDYTPGYLPARPPVPSGSPLDFTPQAFVDLVAMVVPTPSIVREVYVLVHESVGNPAPLSIYIVTWVARSGGRRTDVARIRIRCDPVPVPRDAASANSGSALPDQRLAV